MKEIVGFSNVVTSIYPQPGQISAVLVEAALQRSTNRFHSLQKTLRQSSEFQIGDDRDGRSEEA